MVLSVAPFGCTSHRTWAATGRIRPGANARTAAGLAHDAPILFVDPAGQVVECQADLELSPDRAVATLRRPLR